jgi:cell wall-associated NlpC family hydrolase
MSSRLSHYIAIFVAACFLVTPLVTAATEGKGTGKSKSGETTTTKKKSSPTPQKKSTPAPTAKESTPRSAPKGSKATPRGTPRSTPKATPAPTPTPEPASNPDHAQQGTPKPSSKIAANASIAPEELVEYEQQPPRVKSLIADALAMTKQNLTYTYGSADPSSGGMDCSGTIYYVLRKAGFADVPRDSSSQYAWTRKAGTFRAVVSRSIDSFEFNELLPGDLLFWTGTYDVQREIPVSHVMIYLGTEKATKRKVMFGASDGRSYAGIARNGVSVFDFKMPRTRADRPAAGEGRGAVFIGYARIPGLRENKLGSPFQLDASSDLGPEEATTRDKEPSPSKSEAAPGEPNSKGGEGKATPAPRAKSKTTSTSKSTPRPKKRSRAN